MKSIWGTDARCSRDHADAERMVAETEAKVNRLQQVLDERPKNLDEALYQMTHRERG